MATYKVIQDIEAEDKFVGPLTLKQFVFAMFGVLFGYLSFVMLTKGLLWTLIITLPPAFFGFFMAIPWSSEQPTDLWVLAKIRFRLKPKKRIWDQSGMEQLVTITAPKKEERPKTKDLSETEVRSRLKALAETIDSRGWIIKTGALQASSDADSDRLVSPELMPTQATASSAAVPDVFEEEHGLDDMILAHEGVRKAEIYEKMDMARYGQPLPPAESEPKVLPPEEAFDEKALSETLKAKRVSGNVVTGNMHGITLGGSPTKKAISQDDADDTVDEAKAAEKTGAEKAQASMPEPVSPDILELAGNNDLNVSTIARQANNKKVEQESDEVVISLH